MIYIYANMDPSWVYEVFSKIFPDSVKHGQTSPASSVRHFESVPKLLWSSPPGAVQDGARKQ